MDRYEVPCPSCGSVEVIVGGQSESSSNRSLGGEGKASSAYVRRCSCRDCRHSFQHDFTFSR